MESKEHLQSKECYQVKTDNYSHTFKCLLQVTKSNLSNYDPFNINIIKKKP